MAEDTAVWDSNIHDHEDGDSGGNEDSISLGNESRESNSSISLLSEPSGSIFVRFYRQHPRGTVDYMMTDASALNQSLLDVSRTPNQSQPELGSSSSFQNVDDLDTPAVVLSSPAIGMSPNLTCQAQASSERRVSEMKFLYIPDVFGANCLQYALEAPCAESPSQVGERSLQENSGFWNEVSLTAENHPESNTESQVNKELPKDKLTDFDDPDDLGEDFEICDCKRIHLTRPSSGSLKRTLRHISGRKNPQRPL